MARRKSKFRPCESLLIVFLFSDLNEIDNPIIYASEGFTRYTGYSKEEIEGRNCRFLQGKDSSPVDVKKIRDAIIKKEPVSLCLLNYRKDGSTFLNQVM
jgi:PAS domain S-box-containing protein